MLRLKPKIYFNSNEKNIAKTDSYVEFWLRDLSKYFSIIFLDVHSSPFISKRASYFTKDRCYTSFDLIYSDMFAAFCFGRGSMCSRYNSMRLLEKGILRIAVIYDNFIFNEMKKAISNGLFDIVLLSSFSKGSEVETEIIQLNPLQQISYIVDSFCDNISSEPKDGFGVLFDPTTVKKHMLKRQTSILNDYLENCIECNIRRDKVIKFNNGVIIMPQDYGNINIIRHSFARLCEGESVFVPAEIKDKIGFGVGYFDIKEIKVLPIKAQDRNTLGCFNKNSFMCNIMSIINRS